MIKFLKQKKMACPQCLKHSFCRRGFTLVETLVAISIFTVSLLGIMSVLASSISNTSYAKQKTVATYLAQEGIEYMRNVRDTDVLFYDPLSKPNGWNEFNLRLSQCNSSDGCSFSLISPNFSVCDASNSCRLYLNNSNGSYSTDPNNGSDSGFVRRVWLTTDNAYKDYKVKISSMVQWNQGSGSYNVTFSEDLFNWVE